MIKPFFCVLAFWVASTAPAAEKNGASLLDINFEQLMDMEVSTAARKPQVLHQTAAAAFVISRDDIRRSGADSIPEALRMSPGVEVAQISPTKWSVTIRGFSGRFANKLLVLIDGRSVYTPTFGGVYWELNDIPLDDVERIEVIRGPGATLWGNNAVNGIINVITRHASLAPGAQVTAKYGDRRQGLSGRWSGDAGPATTFRVVAENERSSGFRDVRGMSLADDFHRQSMGLRVDAQTAPRDHLSLFANVLDLDQGEEFWFPSPPRGSRGADRVAARSANIMARWERSLEIDSELSLQISLDHYRYNRQSVHEQRSTLDVDFQHRSDLTDRHELVWGFGLRHSSDDVATREDMSRMTPASRTLDTVSGFIQDEIALVEDRFWLTLGSKLEHHDYSGFELQPNVRALWKPDDDQSLWASVARVSRSPSRYDRDYWGMLAAIPRGHVLNPLPTTLWVAGKGSPGFASEHLVAFELGYRVRAGDNLVFDTALFYNRYEDLRDMLSDRLYVDQGHTIGEVVAVNNIEGSTYGFELAADWRPSRYARLQFSYSLLQFDLRSNELADAPFVIPGTTEIYTGYSPEQQCSLRGSWSPHANLDLDLWLRAVDTLPGSTYIAYGGLRSIDRYLELDARIAWRPTADLELAVVGKNLLNPRHFEYAEEFWSIPGQVPRSVMGTMTLRF